MTTIPINQEDVLNTTKQLPRLPSDAGLIPVGLKRKQNYKHCHKKEYIDSNKIFKALDYIKRQDIHTANSMKHFYHIRNDVKPWILMDMTLFLEMIHVRKRI